MQDQSVCLEVTFCAGVLPPRLASQALQWRVHLALCLPPHGMRVDATTGRHKQESHSSTQRLATSTRNHPQAPSAVCFRIPCRLRQA